MGKRNFKVPTIPGSRFFSLGRQSMYCFNVNLKHGGDIDGKIVKASKSKLELLNFDWTNGDFGQNKINLKV